PDPCPPVGGVLVGVGAVGGVVVEVASGVTGVVVDSAHTPLVHTSLSQTMPQSPQLKGSLLRSAHRPPHMTVGETQPISTRTGKQVPPSQTPLAQAMPHAPQLKGSVLKSAHSPAHS